MSSLVRFIAVIHEAHEQAQRTSAHDTSALTMRSPARPGRGPLNAMQENATRPQTAPHRAAQLFLASGISQPRWKSRTPRRVTRERVLALRSKQELLGELLNGTSCDGQMALARTHEDCRNLTMHSGAAREPETRRVCRY